MFARVRLLVFAAALLAPGGCAHLPSAGQPLRTSETFVTLHGHALRLHLSWPTPPAPGAALLVYATGDAGWWGKDRDIFRHLETWGYPAVGFSAREYVHHLGHDTVSSAEVGTDYRSIIAAALAALGQPSTTRALLVGKSRGAGLSVAAALSPGLNAVLDGVMAVGLTREEEYVRTRVRGSPSRELQMLETYARLPDIGLVPVAVIQSTHDDYVPAAEARELFGPDTATRELVAVESRNHNFGGAVDRLYAEMARSLEWMLHR